MGEMTQEEINVSLFDELKEARKTIEQLQIKYENSQLSLIQANEVIDQLEAEKAATALSTTRVLKQNEKMRAKWNNFQAIEIDGKGYYIEPAAYRHIEQLQVDKQLLWDAMGEMRQCYFETDHPDFVPPPEEET